MAPTETQSNPVRPSISLSSAISTALALALVCLAALFALDHALLAPDVESFDQALQSSMHAHASPILTVLAKAVSFIGSPRTIWPVTILLATILWLRRPRRPAYLLALTMIASGAFESLIKLFVRRPRPTLPWAYVHEHSYSFPSGHATLAIALYGILIWITLRTPHPRRQRAAAILGALTLIPAIGLSRIYLGAHYPTDVLAGYLMGAATLALIVAADLAI